MVTFGCHGVKQPKGLLTRMHQHLTIPGRHFDRLIKRSPELGNKGNYSEAVLRPRIARTVRATKNLLDTNMPAKNTITHMINAIRSIRVS